ncbi:MAG TPA: hypothetical protein VK718_02085 [Ferruginibacter sp.]|jgi:hypothetical protein|nr:hypothetical protein [Ferruginibacter sp.]
MLFGFDVFNQNFIGFWFILAFINAGLAQSKNKDGLTWGLISIALGPVATILIVISKKEFEE